MKSNRRKFIQNLGAGAAGISLGSSAISMGSCSSASETKTDDAQTLFIGDDIAVANTQYGKVKGYILRGINYFLGIPYGADTSGANRFMPPQKPEPWSDIYPAVWWGNSAPQEMNNRYANKYGSFRDHWNYDDVSEDCLRINVFTPAINDGKKRPVMLWMHGGGFMNGSGIEHDGYNGENFARYGNIVFCSVNHRLGPLGFSDFSEVGGEKYAASGNVGMLDLVAALEWVRDNITNFGGDPANVTIMGQSGGGAKVCTTTAMPSAKGLFKKAVVLSGARVEVGVKEKSQLLGAYIIKEAGLQTSQIDKLQQLPWIEYYDLAMKSLKKLSEESGTGGLGFSPTVDGQYISQQPFKNGASPNVDEIPMLICSCTSETSPSWADSTLEGITLDGVKEKLTVTYGEKTVEIVDGYASAFPDKKPVEIWSMITTHRQRNVAVADAKSKQKAAVYMAWFGWQPPLFDNRMRSFHCVDICFWYYNTDLMLSHTGGGIRPRSLSTKMAGSLLNFMNSGDPNGGGLPTWPKYTAEAGEVMMLDDVCEVKNDPDREARKSLPAL